MDSFKPWYPKEDYLTMLQFVITQITLQQESIEMNFILILLFNQLKQLSLSIYQLESKTHWDQQHLKKFEIKLMKKGRFLLPFFYGIKTHYKEKLVILINKCNVNPNSGFKLGENKWQIYLETKISSVFL